MPRSYLSNEDGSILIISLRISLVLGGLGIRGVVAISSMLSWNAADILLGTDSLEAHL